MSSTTKPDVNPGLKALTDVGVSVWLDQVSRTLVAGGELARIVAQDSLRGFTSNPLIFEKAIIESNAYDEFIRSMACGGHDVDPNTMVGNPRGDLGLGS